MCYIRLHCAWTMDCMPMFCGIQHDTADEYGSATNDSVLSNDDNEDSQLSNNNFYTPQCQKSVYLAFL